MRISSINLNLTTSAGQYCSGVGQVVEVSKVRQSCSYQQTARCYTFSSVQAPVKVCGLGVAGSGGWGLNNGDIIVIGCESNSVTEALSYWLL